MIAILIGGPHDGLLLTADKGRSWVTEDGELRLPKDHFYATPEDTEFAIYVKVTTEGQETKGTLHPKGAYKFSRYWTRPEELT